MCLNCGNAVRGHCWGERLTPAIAASIPAVPRLGDSALLAVVSLSASRQPATAFSIWLSSE